MNTSNFISIPASMFEDREILVCGERRYTYGALWREVRRTAGALAGLGVARGDCVAALQTTSHHYVVAYYACAVLGAVFLPLSFRARAQELREMIERGRTRVVLFGRRYAETVRALREETAGVARWVPFEEADGDPLAVESLLRDSPVEIEVTETDDEETTILMYTSGTTSAPKAVLLTHNDFTAYVCNSVELADGTSRGTALVSVPLYHIAGVTALMTNLFSGRRMVLLPQFDVDAWLSAVERERVTHAFLVPTMVKRLIDSPRFAACDLSSLQAISYGGAPMPLPVIRRAIEAFPSTVEWVNAFGQTETTSTLTVLGPDDHRLDVEGEALAERLTRLQSIGRPLPDVELRVVDEEENALPPGQVGELWVRTPRVMKGYGTADGVDSPLRPGGWLPTRDLGWIDEGGYVFLAGRKDDAIIRGGENIAPAEVESVLYAHPAVDEVAVVGIPDEEWGQRVAAAVVPRAGRDVDREELRAFCKARIASFKVPETIRVVAELPRNPLGKLLRGELRQLLAGAEG